MLQAKQGSTAERPPGERLTGWLTKESSLRMAEDLAGLAEVLAAKAG